MKIAILALLTVGSASACSSVACGPARHGGTHADNGAATESVVSGTCLDAETGERLSGVKVEGPDGKSAVSGRDGRFEIHGLRTGESGTLVATLTDGRRATLQLRPLSAGTLEVVLQLTPER